MWNDLVPDGKRVAGESGLAGVTVTLSQGGTTRQALTDGTGAYSFTGLADGTYNVAVTLPNGGTLTTPAAATVHITGSLVSPSEVDFGVQIPPTVIPNTDVTNDSTTQQMPSVAVDPHDASHVVMAYMDYSLQSNGFAAGIGVKVSHNYGATWTTTSVPLPSDYSQAAGSPVVKFDNNGNFYVAYMAATFKGTDSHGNPLLPGIIYDTSTATVDGQSVNRRVFGMTANNGIFVAQATDDGLGNIGQGLPNDGGIPPLHASQRPRRHGPKQLQLTGALRCPAGPGDRHQPREPQLRQPLCHLDALLPYGPVPGAADVHRRQRRHVLCPQAQCFVLADADANRLSLHNDLILRECGPLARPPSPPRSWPRQSRWHHPDYRSRPTGRLRNSVVVTAATATTFTATFSQAHACRFHTCRAPVQISTIQDPRCLAVRIVVVEGRALGGPSRTLRSGRMATVYVSMFAGSRYPGLLLHQRWCERSRVPTPSTPSWASPTIRSATR